MKIDYEANHIFVSRLENLLNRGFKIVDVTRNGGIVLCKTEKIK